MAGGMVAMKDSYLSWVARETPTAWWHDSANLDELKRGLSHGAVGVTTNPVLVAKTLNAESKEWGSIVREIPSGISPEGRAEALMKNMVTRIAGMLQPIYEETSGKHGYVCAQVNPAIASNAKAMAEMARRFHAWAPNIAVKLPVTAAGLETLEECAAEGITITATVSFTVPQVIAVAERYRLGLKHAHKSGKKTGRCFAVIMIGRLDDYLKDVAQDRKAGVSESDIRQAGLAVTKRAYAIYKERNYEATLLVAALRGAYHMEELAGAELIMSIHPKYQEILLQPNVKRELGINKPVTMDVIRHLETIPEFVRAYEPDGMTPEEFITYGVTQRTLEQFKETGWALIESFNP